MVFINSYGIVSILFIVFFKFNIKKKVEKYFLNIYKVGFLYIYVMI